jgi:hypothetical protein
MYLWGRERYLCVNEYEIKGSSKCEMKVCSLDGGIRRGGKYKSPISKSIVVNE